MSENAPTFIQQAYERRAALYWMAQEIAPEPTASGWRQAINNRCPEASDPASHVDEAIGHAIHAVESTILTMPPETTQDALIQLSVAGLLKDAESEEVRVVVEIGHDGALAYLAREAEKSVDTLKKMPELDIIAEGLRLARHHNYQEPEHELKAA